MKNYSQVTTNVPQTQPLPGHNMTKNNAGGYSFEITPQQRLERFLLIGSEKGTYYVGEQKLTIENAQVISNLIKTDGLKVVDTVVQFAEANRAPKADAGLFVLALAASFGDAVTKTASYNAIYRVCKTSTHLFTFLANIHNLRGWSRGLRRGVSNFYLSKSADKIAYQMVKYRNRAGFTHQDVLRLAHPMSIDKAVSNLFGYAVGKVSPEESGSELIRAYEAAQHASGKELIALINEFKLTWEMIPNEQLNDKEVLKALLPSMPLTALVRNLNRYSYNGLTDSNNETVQAIVSKLSNEDFVKRSGIHPINVVNSLMTYSSGHGQKSSKTWTPNQNIVDALSNLYDLSLKYVESSGKNILVAVDISGSMQHPVNGMDMSCSQIANVLAVTILKTEKNAEMIWFDTTVRKPTLGRRNSIDEIIKQSPTGGGTDCGQAFVHALTTKTKYDSIIILTDNETWAGPRHGVQLLEQYRRGINRDVKVVEVAMVANHSSSYPDDDQNVMRVVGFDASVVNVINEFVK
jgi:60 kDa SS-A/Ro ribonucleoprotein